MKPLQLFDAAGEEYCGIFRFHQTNTISLFALTSANAVALLDFPQINSLLNFSPD